MTTRDIADLSSRLDDLGRLLALLVGKDYDTQSELVLALHSAGFESVRIATLTGAKPDTVRKAIQRAKLK